jgi:hypothetical protein
MAAICYHSERALFRYCLDDFTKIIVLHKANNVITEKLSQQNKIKVMLNGAPGVMIKNTKIKAKVFNRKDSFLALQCIECTIFKNILPFLYS